MATLILPKKVLVTLDIFYYMPKHVHLINEFLWQTEDIYPEFNRARAFMNVWRTSINAVISETVMAYSDGSRWSRVDIEKVLK